MWYPVAPVAPAAEPITLALAKEQCGVLDDDFDGLLTRLAKAARSHAEGYCSQYFAVREMVANADSFSDMARLPFAPVDSIVSIEYVDTDGATQTLADTVYELRADGIEAAVVLKHGQSWPAIQHGSHVTLTASVGAAPPDDVVHAMLLLVGHWFNTREAVNVGNIVTEMPMGVEALLCNHRRFA